MIETQDPFPQLQDRCDSCWYRKSFPQTSRPGSSISFKKKIRKKDIRPNWIKAILNKRREPYSWTDERLRPFTRVNTETDNSRCPQTDATKQVKDNGQYSWIGKTYYHSRKRTVDDSRPGWTDATKKADYRMFLEAVLDPSDPSRFRK